MKKICMILVPAVVSMCMLTQHSHAQGYGGPLTFQGLDQFQMHSAAGRAMGGLSMGVQNEAGLMFHNPASLQSIRGLQISVGGFLQSTKLEQIQNYAPVRHYPNLSLLLESRTHLIPDPSNPGFTQQDTVQRPFDDIGPNWTRSNSDAVPLQAFIAAPFAIGGVEFAAGAGFVQYANLNHYFQNNNVLDPPVLSQRPLPILRPSDGSPIDADWSQASRHREGYIYGYGAALSAALPGTGISLGVSGMLLQGTSDDVEHYRSRGNLRFFANSFRLDSTYHRVSRTGTSDYEGIELAVSSVYNGEYISIGISARPPAKITRTFSTEVSTDTTGTPVVSTVTGEDEFELPWRGAVGLMLYPRENLKIGFDYEFRPYSSAVHTAADGSESSPWVSSSVFRIGAEYEIAPWLALRAGLRGHAEIFEREGNPVPGEPVRSEIYTAGFGLFFSGVRLNVAYENRSVTYEDIWGSALSKNSDRRHTIAADISYRIPWMR
jgi:hypothetical protein